MAGSTGLEPVCVLPQLFSKQLPYHSEQLPIWCEKQDLNLRQLVYETGILTKLNYFHTISTIYKNGAPQRI